MIRRAYPLQAALLASTNLVALNQIFGHVSRDPGRAGPVEASWGFSNHPRLQPPGPPPA